MEMPREERRAFGAVPEIDMAPFVAWWERRQKSSLESAAGPPIDTEARRVVAEVGRACREVGFLILTNSGIPPSLMENAMLASRRFFSSPEERKKSATCTGSRYARGYERLRGKEAFEMGREPALNANQPPPPLYEANRWPVPDNGSPTFRAVAAEYYTVALQAARCLFAAMCIALDEPLDGETFSYTSDPLAQLRMWRYEGGGDDGGLPEHTDHGFLTLLLQDGSGGLQIRNAAGCWIDVPPAPSTLVVNTGRLLAQWTRNDFPATVHRVLRNTKDRYSIALFWAPSHDCRIRVESGGSSEDVSVGEYIEEGYRWQGSVNAKST